jgi:hypothetical protein
MMKKLKAELGIDDTFTKVRNTKKKFSTIKDNIPLIENYNMMADLMFLPTDAFGFKYALVVVDLADDSFDIQELKSKDANVVLKGLKKIFTRPYIKKPYASLTTDAGTEFRGVFQDYLFDESIYHKTTKIGRHQQLANIDNLIRQISGLLIGLSNKEEMKTGKVSKAWVKHLPKIRKKLNELRVKELPDDFTEFDYPTISTRTNGNGKLAKIIPQKYKIGDYVHIKLDVPTDVNGKKLSGKFREGDLRYDSKPRKVTRVLYYSGNVLHRYLVEGITNASYSDDQMFKAS